LQTTVGCLLPAACCLLPAACCLLPAACRLLPAACRLLPAALASRSRSRPDAAARRALAPSGALRPGDVLRPVLRQLQALEGVFARQARYQLYSASVLLTYEGEAAAAEEARVQLRLVDFAHVFSSCAGSAEVLRPGGAVAHSEGQVDENFLQGLRGLMGCVEQCLAAGAGEGAARGQPAVAAPAREGGGVPAGDEAHHLA
jgi:hypothetical protein